MIDKSYGKFYTICDGCGEELDPTDTFDEAKSQADAEGWEVRREGQEWINLCSDCAKEG